MADQVSESSPENASTAPGGGGSPPGQQPGAANPSVYTGMSRAPVNPSMAPQTMQKRGGGMINKLKLPGLGMNDISGNNLIVKQLLGEFLGTALLVFFGIGSIVTAKGTVIGLYINESPGLVHVPSRIPTEDLDSFNPDIKKKGYSYYYLLNPSGGGVLHISFAFGIAVASIAQAIGHISGCHLNPAVSVGLLTAGECSVMKTIIYSVTQIIGALSGAGLLKLCSWKILDYHHACVHDLVRLLQGGSSGSGLSTFPQCPNPSPPGPPPPGSPPPGSLVPKTFDPEKLPGWHLGVSTLGAVDPATGIAIELILTFILVLVVCGVCDGGRKDIQGSAALAIGLTVFLCHVVGIGYTGSSVNPARSIGPVLFVSSDVVPFRFIDLGIYIVGPLLGGALAGLVYNVFFRVPDDPAPLPPTRGPSEHHPKTVMTAA